MTNAETPAAVELNPTEDWAIHGQATLTEMGHAGFHSAYSGTNSLDHGRRGDETTDETLFLGARLWSGAELWANPEIDQGFGFNNSVGAAGFPSGGAYKVGARDPYFRFPRLFLRQTIDLGGDVQSVDPDLNWLGGTRTANRVVVTVGKFSVVDIFDTNKYAHDPRSDFLNWSLVDGGAFDYAADAWGYTAGGVAEWYQNWWTLRAGLFDGSNVPNSKRLESAVGRQFQSVIEAEARYDSFGQTGKVKLLGFLTLAKLGTFAGLSDYFAANPNGDNVSAESVRHIRNKFGGMLNIEQPLTEDFGLFLRASLSDGHTEAYDFTDIDQSISFGAALNGNRWGRNDDNIGLAFAVNQISHAHKVYFEQGNYGPLVGDGKLLHAGPEQIIEAFYAWVPTKWATATADFQVINNPGYNVDRGPVFIFGGRLHLQY